MLNDAATMVAIAKHFLISRDDHRMRAIAEKMDEFFTDYNGDVFMSDKLGDVETVNNAVSFDFYYHLN